MQANDTSYSVISAMEEASTDSLRQLATRWTLAGDDHLLTILQDTHQRIISHCNNVTERLGSMVTSLDDASVSLQNVNNRFMALSNSQFIESRVYDDDADVATEPPAPKEIPKILAPDLDVQALKQSLLVLESAHETLTILHDSDTDTDSEDDMPARTVLRPKDMYPDRPLPYIIGSQAWKNKWHAGLVCEDSDSDSSASKRARSRSEYSESEPEVDPEAPLASTSHVTVSESSSEQEVLPAAVKQTPSDIAAELARRLGGQPAQVTQQEERYDPPGPTMRKVYRPEQPPTGTVFPDEPPPLDSSSESQDEDIFAALHKQKHQPYAYNHDVTDLFTNNVVGSGVDEGVGGGQEEGDIFSDFKKPMIDASAKQNSPLFREPKVLDKSQPVRGDNDASKDLKKPVGGISLFGSNKGTESIGAAILNRNRRHSTSGDSESETETPPPRTEPAKKEKDIFDDLFAKSQNIKFNHTVNPVKDVKTNTHHAVKDIKTNTQTENVVNERKVDLFSDNIFDDIDDIFTTNVVKVPEKSKKSIFEDDDDLFSEIAAPKTVKTEPKSSDNKKDLFADSDEDELFGAISKDNASGITQTNSTSESSKISKEINILDDANNLNNSNVSNEKVQSNVRSVNNSIKNVNTSKTDSKAFKSPSLFDDDDDDDEDDLFGKPVHFSKNTQNDVKITEINYQHSNNLFKNEKNDDGNDAPKKSDNLSQNETANIETEGSISKADPVIENIPRATVVDETVSTCDTDFDLETEAQITKVSDNNVNNNNTIKHTEVISKTVDVKNVITDKLIIHNTSSDDDFEQDFDDIPETKDLSNNSKVLSQNVPKTNTSDIFEDEIDDLFKKSTQRVDDIVNNTHNPEGVLKRGETHAEKDDKLFLNGNATEVLDDIFSEPPVFEKPKEPKKSKNINALFDDDSDDEALFFKKDEVISDEKPEEYKLSQDRFDIFIDEPPDVEVSSKMGTNDDDLFNTLPKPEIPKIATEMNKNTSKESEYTITTNTYNVKSEFDSKNIDLDGDIFKSIPKTVKNQEVIDDEDLFNIPEVENEPSSSQSETKVNKSIEIVKNELLQTTTSKETKSLLSDDEELFKSVSIMEKTDNILSDEAPAKKHVIDPESKSDIKTVLNASDDEELFKSQPKTETTTSDIKIESKEPSSNTDESPKRVGKLKNMNFNINVNALLPGASPKKHKTEQPDTPTDSKTISQNINSKIETQKYFDESDSITENTRSDFQIPSTDKLDSKIVRSVNFDEKQESEVLDNKLSKERAKIQVKRRPSTRRARREAVRKSAIDFGDDSTDNSSSIDDPPRNLPSHTEKPKNTQNADKTNISITQKTENSEMSATKLDIAAPVITPTVADIRKENLQTVPNNTEINRNVKSKIVYILHDEDIFNTNVDNNPVVNTLGNLYTPEDPSRNKSGDEKAPSDSVKKGIFDSDSDDGLFTNKREVKNVAKGPLFSDDDDDDLFGVKKSNDSKPQSSKSTTNVRVSKSSKPVLADPLSFLTDD